MLQIKLQTHVQLITKILKKKASKKSGTPTDQMYKPKVA
jgi:hypothetical protein